MEHHIRSPGQAISHFAQAASLAPRLWGWHLGVGSRSRITGSGKPHFHAFGTVWAYPLLLRRVENGMELAAHVNHELWTQLPESKLTRETCCAESGR